VTVDEIIAAARAALGTPFVHQGRQVGVALDCAGLMDHVATVLDVPHVDVAAYARRPSGGRLEATFDAHVASGVIERVLPISQRKAGDILIMHFGGEPQHIAIFSGQTIIHSWQGPGKVCEHRMDDVWVKRIVRVYRFVGVEE
jgi:cell wall-associated NlpC family hydrolase